MATVEVNGLHLGHRRAGSGPPVVFVHAGAQDGRAWSPQLDNLVDEFTVVAWDEPGAGASDDLPPGFGLRDYGDCLAGFFRALDLAPAAVVGLSWGTTVMLEAYRRHPEVFARLVLVGGYAGWRGSLGAAEARARLDGALGALEASEDGFDPTLPGLFAGSPPEEFVPLLAAMAADVRRPSMCAGLTAMAHADLTATLPTVDVPTLLVWGARDVRSPVSVARDFTRLIPHASLELIPACGHLCNLEAPRAFNALVRDFLRE